MTNKQVTAYLRANGLGKWCEGVVFLDESDEKVVLVKATGRVVKLAQCGIGLEARFAFYDQVHTTGMDIHHALTARAALTLGKDMVFRELAQGAYRMRGIGKGQTVTFLVIPEVQQLIKRQLGKAGYADGHVAKGATSSGWRSRTSPRGSWSTRCGRSVCSSINSSHKTSQTSGERTLSRS